MWSAAMHVRLFGVRRRASPGLLFFGHPHRGAAGSADGGACRPLPTVVPCARARWICACIREKYREDPRHQEYVSVWRGLASAADA